MKNFTAALLLLLLHPNTAETQVARFGACFHEPTQTPRCAFSKSSCHAQNEGDTIYQGGEVWMTPFQLEQSGMSCSCAKIDIGSCTLPNDKHGESYPSRCTASRASCDVLKGSFGGVGYHRNDGGTCTCRAYTDHEFLPGKDVVDTPTSYGACRGASGTEDRCSFDPSDCGTGETWVSHLEARCTCADVKVGACYHALGSICAVRGDACSGPSRWITPIEAEEKGMDCRLCSFDEAPSDSNARENSEDGVGGEPPAGAVANGGDSSSSRNSTGWNKDEGEESEGGRGPGAESSVQVMANNTDLELNSGLKIALYTVSVIAVTSSVSLIVVLYILIRRNKREEDALTCCEEEKDSTKRIEIDMLSVS